MRVSICEVQKVIEDELKKLMNQKSFLFLKYFIPLVIAYVAFDCFIDILSLPFLYNLYIAVFVLQSF